MQKTHLYGLNSYLRKQALKRQAIKENALKAFIHGTIAGLLLFTFLFLV